MNNQHFYCIWECYNVSNYYWLHNIFFFYCLYPQTWNDGITVDVKEWVSFMPYQNKTKKKILVTGSTYPRSTMLTVRTVPSSSRLLGSRDRVNYTGPTKCLRIISLILRIKKWNQLLKTSKISRGYTINQKVPKIFKIHVLLCTLGNRAQLECGKERKCFFKTFFFSW